MDALANKVAMHQCPVSRDRLLAGQDTYEGIPLAPCSALSRAQEVVFDLDAAAFSSDDFRIFQFKVSFGTRLLVRGSETLRISPQFPHR